MSEDNISNPILLDALKELANIGTGHAVTALSSMIGKFVSITVPEVYLESISKVADVLGNPEEEVAASYVGYHGELDGGAMLIFDSASTHGLVQTLMGADMDLTDPMAMSMMQEVGNILVGSFVSALASFFGSTIYAEPPGVAVDMLGAVLNVLLAEVGQHADHLIVAKTTIAIEDVNIRGWIVDIPTPESFQRITEKLGL
ncbi:chemotaxis protein CheC [Coprothermobacter platensis]|uniref:chemotaxis protein CheC n=1 Tax=Coprothermobacter platensis TaxID=108819 RepID=UPI0003754F05|nr:chemotaxis protein CheC [Coprothermobacter platensis]